MDQTFGDIPYYNVGRLPVTELEPTNGIVEKLSEEIEAKDVQINHLKDELERTKNSVKDAIQELFARGDISTESGEYILEAICVETKVIKQISGVIAFNGEIELSIFDEDSLSAWDFDIDNLSISKDYENVTNLDYSIEDVDVED